MTRDLQVAGVQLDEMHATRRRRRVEWRHPAIAMGRLGVLGIQWGPRTQARAATLIAHVGARVQRLPVWLSDGWTAYPAALWQVVGRVYQGRRRGRRGPLPRPAWFPRATCSTAWAARSVIARGSSCGWSRAWSMAAPTGLCWRWPVAG